MNWSSFRTSPRSAGEAPITIVGISTFPYLLLNVPELTNRDRLAGTAISYALHRFGFTGLAFRRLRARSAVGRASEQRPHDTTAGATFPTSGPARGTPGRGRDERRASAKLVGC